MKQKYTKERSKSRDTRARDSWYLHLKINEEHIGIGIINQCYF